MSTHEEHLELRRKLNDYFPGATPIDLDRLDKRKLHKAAWRLCSLCVRMDLTNPQGFVFCVTCGRKDVPFGGSMQAGHVVGGRRNAILFDERGIWPQCYGCNVPESGKHAEFVRWMDKNHPGVVDDLLSKKRGSAVTFSNEEYIEMIYEYELRLEKYLPIRRKETLK